ncbi:MAG: ArnT family glycosyltransferase, partial [Anaerohalosphaeraceae bacterium]
SAQHLLQGAKLGVEEQSSARPGTLLANVIGVKLFGFNDIGPKVVQMVLQLGALGFMFYALRKVFGSVAAVAGTIVAAVYLSAPLIAKFGNVKEQFMIPFMIAAACCFVLYEYSQKRFWLVLSGFFAVQPYYFKPTGLSILIALLVCIVAGNTLSKNAKQLALDLALFLTGYAAGLLVPGSLYIWQDSFSSILRTLPAVMLEAGLTLGAIAVGIAGVVYVIKKYRIGTQLKCVSKWIWIGGLCLLLIALIVSISMIKKEPGSENSDIVSYFQDLPVVSQLYFMIDTNISNLLRSAGLRGGYVSNSWKAIDMSSLRSQIFRYYKALSVPILLALGSIITAVCIWISRLLRKIKNTPKDIQSKLVWLLALWWLLDMAFVWGSPRSYEQYYLPLCGSGAMLGGFIIWKWQN